MERTGTPLPRQERIRVVVADDSGFMRKLISDALASRGHEVVGQAADGDQALALCERLKPDVLSLDLAMPGLDGIGVLKRLRASATPIPVVVVSAFSPAHGARAIDALAEGAVELVAKPSDGEPLRQFFGELADKVALASASRPPWSRALAPRVAPPARPATPARPPAPWRKPAEPASPAAPMRGRSRPAPAPAPAPVPVDQPARQRPAKLPAGERRAVVIACSTGGPQALAELLPKLPAPLGQGVLIVQHMPPGFTASLAERLDKASPLTVVEARGGEALDPRVAYLCPGGSHLRVGQDKKSRLTDEAPIGGLRPRADLTIEDAARLWGDRLLLVVLTGMGSDGLAGARVVKQHGGVVVVEAEETCTVYGMPRAVAEAGLADHVVPLNRIHDTIVQEAGR
ncbi:MAG: chemotaxis-specific protein-glutamate methyltransferase CheB [Thermoleophilia bacterium]